MDRGGALLGPCAPGAWRGLKLLFVNRHLEAVQDAEAGVAISCALGRCRAVLCFLPFFLSLRSQRYHSKVED